MKHPQGFLAELWLPFFFFVLGRSGLEFRRLSLRRGKGTNGCLHFKDFTHKIFEIRRDCPLLLMVGRVSTSAKKMAKSLPCHESSEPQCQSHRQPREECFCKFEGSSGLPDCTPRSRQTLCFHPADLPLSFGSRPKSQPPQNACFNLVCGGNPRLDPFRDPPRNQEFI